VGEKIEKLVDGELNLIPAVVKPFLHKADADVEAKNFMTMGFMAYAYGKAFDELAEPALAEWPKRDFITQPMVYLARALYGAPSQKDDQGLPGLSGGPHGDRSSQPP
jgi:hypothetical protein